MGKDSEAQAALRRLARALEPVDNVKSVHGENCDGDWHAWVVVSERSWKNDHDVIQAHVEVDPDFYLTLHVTERADKVPEDAIRIVGHMTTG